jgi:hypothetical protein
MYATLPEAGTSFLLDFLRGCDLIVVLLILAVRAKLNALHEI